MKRIKKLIRVIQICLILDRYDLDKHIFPFRALLFIRIIRNLNPKNWRRMPPLSRGEAIRCALEELGPIFVKFGQAVSTRRDLLPLDIADELAKLQDRVPPFSGDKAKVIIERAYGKALHEIFYSFETEPLASASIAQVHAVTLLDGEEAALKVLRPKMKKVVKRDIELLYTLASLAEKYMQDGRRLRPVEVVAEFEKTIFDELDLMREAANASQLRRNFENSPMLYVPKVYWPYTRENVMVMERIHGIPITDMDGLKRHKINIKKLAERGVEIFFLQVLRDSFFHADMHPGNIFVSTKNPEDPQYLCVDFGIMGTLTDTDKHYLAENFHAFFHRDYRRIAELHVASGWVPLDTRVDEFEAAIRTVCEPIFERPLREISCAHMLLQLFQTARRFNMESQPHLVLLQKTLFAIEGLGRQLYPDLDLWSTAKPFLERWVKEQHGPQAFWQQLTHHAPRYMNKLPELPGLIHEVLTLARNNQLELQEHKKKQPKTQKMNHYAFGVGLVLLLSALTVSFFDQQMYVKPFALSTMSISFAAVGTLSLLWSWWRR